MVQTRTYLDQTLPNTNLGFGFGGWPKPDCWFGFRVWGILKLSEHVRTLNCWNRYMSFSFYSVTLKLCEWQSIDTVHDVLHALVTSPGDWCVTCHVPRVTCGAKAINGLHFSLSAATHWIHQLSQQDLVISFLKPIFQALFNGNLPSKILSMAAYWCIISVTHLQRFHPQLNWSRDFKKSPSIMRSLSPHSLHVVSSDWPRMVHTMCHWLLMLQPLVHSQSLSSSNLILTKAFRFKAWKFSWGTLQNLGQWNV